MHTPSGRESSDTALPGPGQWVRVSGEGEARCATLILVCGLPGSGKTSFATRSARDLGAVRLCPDEWMASLGTDVHDEDARTAIEALQWSLAEEMLGLGQSVIIEWGLWARAEREALRLRARELEVRVELHYLEAPLEVLWERIRARNQVQPWGTATIERSDLNRWAATFEAPDAREQSLYDVPLQ